MKNSKLYFMIPLLIIVALLPLVGLPLFVARILMMTFLYIILSESWNMIGGYAGYLSFGNVAFFGIGAYTTGVLFQFGFSPFLTAGLGGVLAAVCAIGIGYPCFRIRGVYFVISFCIITLTLPLIFRLLMFNLEVTGGPKGLYLIPGLHADAQTYVFVFYLAYFVLMVGTIFVSYKLEKSRTGYGLFAIREDELVAETLAINTMKLKMIAFSLSAFITGIAGGLFSYYLTYIDPDTVFSLFMSFNMVILAVLGGRGHWQGPIIGSLILIPLTNFLGFVIVTETYRVIYGAILFAIIMVMPNGIYGYIKEKRSRRSLNPKVN
jgi:branched-chain amino acid transport system permease protein